MECPLKFDINQAENTFDIVAAKNAGTIVFKFQLVGIHWYWSQVVPNHLLSLKQHLQSQLLLQSLPQARHQKQLLVVIFVLPRASSSKRSYTNSRLEFFWSIFFWRHLEGGILKKFWFFLDPRNASSCLCDHSLIDHADRRLFSCRDR